MQYEKPEMEQILLPTAEVFTLTSDDDSGSVVNGQSVSNDWL